MTFQPWIQAKIHKLPRDDGAQRSKGRSKRPKTKRRASTATSNDSLELTSNACVVRRLR